MVAIQAPYPPVSASNPQKRPISSLQSTVMDDSTQPKKQQIAHLPGFCDNLSSVPLTRSALDELDRRNNTHARGLRRSTRRPVRSRPQETPSRSPSGQQLQRIKRFASHGGPELFDLRGWAAPRTRMSSGRRRGARSTQRKASQSNEKSTTTSTRSTGPYDQAFSQHLIDHNILPDEYEYPDGTIPAPPANRGEILRELALSRRSLSPSKFSHDQFREFKRADAHALKERAVTVSVMPIIEGDVGDRKCIAGENPFTNLNPLTDGTLVPGNPDIYYGARPEQLDRTVRQELGSIIIPSTQHDLPIAPNFFVQVKGPDGSLMVANRQASYDAALGARGHNSLQSFGRPEPLYHNNAYTLTSIYHGGQLKMYTSHPIVPAKPGDPPGYAMTQLKTYALTSDPESFRAGAAAYRNGRDWAKRQTYELISRVNMKVATDDIKSTPVGDAVPPSLTSDMSTNGPVIARQESVQLLASDAHSEPESDTLADELLHKTNRPFKRPRSPPKIDPI